MFQGVFMIYDFLLNIIFFFYFSIYNKKLFHCIIKTKNLRKLKLKKRIQFYNHPTSNGFVYTNFYTVKKTEIRNKINKKK